LDNSVILGKIKDAYNGILDQTILKCRREGKREEVREHLACMLDMEQGNLLLNNVCRLEILEGGSFSIKDFTVPSRDVIINKTYIKKELPKWMLDALSVLQILDDGATITNVGKKVDGTVFYLLEPISEES